MSKRTSLKPGALSAKKDADVLLDIHKKIQGSSALNGGFDTLLYKIDKIEQCQGQIVTKVDKIHDSIYDPNDGIFARMSMTKIETSENLADVGVKLAELTEWKKSREKAEARHDQKMDKIDDLHQEVAILSRTKNTTWSILKWLLAAMAGGGMTLLFKWLESKI